jgi:uncharacterized protein YcfJ
MINLKDLLDTAGTTADQLREEVASMIWSREEHKDLFWAGFLAGAVVGGVIGILLASDTGREARRRIGGLAAGVKGRLACGAAAPQEETGSQPSDSESPL